MRLFLTRNTTSEHSRFIVYDECKREKYVITGKRTASTDKMVISSLDGTSLVSIRVAPFHVFYAFSISDKTERFTMVASNIGEHTDYRFHGISWMLSRNYNMHSFSIIDADGTLIMSQSVDKLLSTGTYTLDICCENRELFCIAAAVCADVINYADSATKAII